MNEFQLGAADSIQDWKMETLLHQSGHLCQFRKELCCNLCKGKAEKREPPNDGSSHEKELCQSFPTLSLLTNI